MTTEFPNPLILGHDVLGNPIRGFDRLDMQRIAEKAYEEGLRASLLSNWKPIATAPADVPLLLGWQSTYPPGWQQEVKEAHNTRGGWWHGQATHWMPLPEPPKPL